MNLSNSNSYGYTLKILSAFLFVMLTLLSKDSLAQSTAIDEVELEHSNQIIVEDGPYVRLYSRDGFKLGKGKVVALDGNKVYLRKHKDVEEYYREEIGHIKLKKSASESIGIGSATGLTAGILLAVGSKPDPNAFLDFDAVVDAAGIVGGAVGGAIIGAGISVIGESGEFDIHGSSENWEIFKAYLLDNK